MGTKAFVGDGVSRTATPSSRGALTGFGLVLLGIWGAVSPFVGPYFDYAYAPDKAWTWTAARFWLQVLPGAVAFFAGLILLLTAHRVVAWLAGVARDRRGHLGRRRTITRPRCGGPTTSARPWVIALLVAVEGIGMFYGLGAAIILLAAIGCRTVQRHRRT